MASSSTQLFALRADPNRPPKEEAFRADLNVNLSCPDCQDDSVQIVEEYSSGDLVCANCGLVLGDRIVDTRSEWRTFADSEGDDPSRVGGPTDPLLDAADQFSTIISFKDNNTGTAKALQLAASKQSRSENSGGRNLGEAYRTIGTMCDAISLPKSVQDVTKMLFKRVDEERLLRGKNVNAVIAACIYIACKQGRVPRTFKEIVALTNVSKKEIANCFKVLERAFESMAQPNNASAPAIVPRFCNHIGMPMPLQTASVFVVTRVEELGLLTGRNPSTVAGASILFASTLFGQPKAAKDIAGVAGVQDSTIRYAYRLIVAEKEKVVDQKWFDSERANRASWDNIIG